MKVRALTPNDFNEVQRIHSEGNQEIAAREKLLPAHDTGYGGSWVDVTSDELGDPSHCHLVVDLSGHCAGWGHAYVVQAPDQTLIGYIAAIYVASSMRRRGVATALLNSLIEWLEGQKPNRIELTVVANSEAAEVYRRRGFRPFLETLVHEPR